jgi:hypothetical protein
VTSKTAGLGTKNYVLNEISKCERELSRLWNFFCNSAAYKRSETNFYRIILLRHDILNSIPEQQKINFMRKSKVGLLLAAAAAYGAYKYSRLSPAEKKNLMTRGKDFVNKNVGGLSNLFSKNKSTVNGSTY